MTDMPAASPGSKAYLHVHRQKSIAAGLRRVEIWLDGVQVETLKNGEDTRIEIKPGTHTTVAKMAPFFGSSEFEFTVAEGETQHFELRTSGVNRNAVAGLKLLWLWLIPLAWLPYLVKFHILPQELYKLTYYCLAALIFYFVMIREKKSPGLKIESKVGGIYYQACIPNALPEKKKGWELMSLARVFALLVCALVLPYLTFKTAWPWSGLFGNNWPVIMVSIYYGLMHLVTGWIYQGHGYQIRTSV